MKVKLKGFEGTVQYQYEHLDSALVAIARVMRYAGKYGSAEITKTLNHPNACYEPDLWCVSFTLKNLTVDGVMDIVAGLAEDGAWG